MNKALLLTTMLMIGCAVPEQSSAPGGPNPSPTSPDAHTTESDTPATATDLTFAAFGNRAHPPVIFVHGGPGACSYGFEETAAPGIAKQGYFVVSYDQRGAGRSPKGTAKDYSYEKSTQDLNDLIRSLNLKAPILLGHSFGGSIALEFLERHPGVAKGVILSGSPMSFPANYLTILEHAADVYRKRRNVAMAQAMDALKARMFPNGLVEPFTYQGEDIQKVVEQLGTAGLALPDRPTASALATYARLKAGKHRDLVNAINPEVGDGYQANDEVGHRSFLPVLERHQKMVRAAYGDNDKIFDEAQLAAIRAAVTPEHFALIEDAAHFPFLDQQDRFVEVIVKQLASFAQ